MEQFDVLVVGGGPAGLAVAAASEGRVLVIHRDPQIGRPVRTSGGSWKKPIEQLGLPAELYNPIHSVTFASRSEECSFSYADDCPVVLDVTDTLTFLARKAETQGSEIRRRQKFSKLIDHSADSVICEILLTARRIVEPSLSSTHLAIAMW
jgi:digeranylgeranylglycerophospholipid reductase